MSTLIVYKGIAVISPDPTGAGGLAIQNDLKELADRAPTNDTVNPGANDDSSAGYFVGARWFNETNGTMYVCVDASVDAANWDSLYKRDSTGLTLSPDADGPIFLGDNLNVNGKQIVSSSNGNIVVMPNGTGKVGIGTPSPASLLHVNGSMQVSTIDGIDYNPGSDQSVDLITVGVTGSPRLYWDHANGQFRSPSKIRSDVGLVSGGSITLEGNSFIMGNGSGGTVNFLMVEGSGNTNFRNVTTGKSMHFDYPATNGKLRFRTHDGTNITNRMLMDASGNMIIGAGNPASKLHVEGAVTLDETSAPSTPATGQAAIYLQNVSGSQILRIKFANGTVKDLANDT